MRVTQFCLIALFFASLLAARGLSQAQKQTPATEQFAHLRDQENAALAAGDKQARLRVALEMQKLLNDAPDAVEVAAKAYALAGDAKNALTALGLFADLGQADDPLLSGKSKSFSAIEKLPQYQSILSRFAQNKLVISRAESAFVLSDPRLLTEDIDYDSKSGTFLLTSILEKKIVRLAPGQEAKDLAASPSHWPLLAIKVDAGRNLVWATEVALDGFTAAPKTDWGRSAVLCVDLATGTLLRRIESPAHTALGDMVLTSYGNPTVSDGDGGGVYEVSGERLERVDGGDFISPQTPAMHPDGQHVFIPDYARGIGILSLASKRVVWLNSDARPKYSINGIDRLYFDRCFLIATQNGTFPERVIRFRLDSALSKIISQEIIERATETLGDPTHGVVVGDFFYYIANSGWSEVDEHGDLKEGSMLTPARIMRFPVGDSFKVQKGDRRFPEAADHRRRTNALADLVRGQVLQAVRAD
jgi:hypothetical protein